MSPTLKKPSHVHPDNEDAPEADVVELADDPEIPCRRMPQSQARIDFMREDEVDEDEEDEDEVDEDEEDEDEVDEDEEDEDEVDEDEEGEDEVDEDEEGEDEVDEDDENIDESGEGGDPDVENDPEDDDVETDADNAVSLEFAGNTSEYFRIWIVNVCLTILTLGVFSAWAKVRRQRYLYASTRLDGSPFEYVGRPIPILKGRLIATILAGTWYASRELMPRLTPYVLLVAALLSPWVIAKSMAFRANATAFRNMRLSFAGSVRSAVKLIYGWLLAAAILVGVAYSVIGKRIGVAIGLFTIAALVLGVGYVFLEQKVRQFLVTNTRFGGVAGKFRVTVKDLFAVYLKALLVTFCASMPLSIVLTIASSIKGPAALVLAIVPPYVTLGVFYTYKQARIFKLCWNRTSFGGLYFRCEVAFWELLKLYTVNVLGVVASLGLLIPWATIRTARYRIERTHAYINGAFDEFEATDSPGVNAIGAEIAETFDMDLAF